MFQKWYLIYAEADLGDDYLIVENVNPPISPYLKISETLDFNGNVACNSYTGSFTFEYQTNSSGYLTTHNHSQTNEDCEYQTHTDFEFDYFYYFQDENTELFMDYVEDVNTGFALLDLMIGPGFIYHYQNTPVLSTDDVSLKVINLYPNPVSNTLFISSENTVIEKVIVYSLTGKIVLEITKENNSIDVSTLSKGIYFIIISSASGKSVKKFIKK